MIDLSISGALAFDPKSFSYNPKASNVLLLFSKSGKKYIFSKEKMDELDLNDGDYYTFIVEDVTESITSLEDLTAALGINATASNQ